MSFLNFTTFGRMYREELDEMWKEGRKNNYLEEKDDHWELSREIPGLEGKIELTHSPNHYSHPLLGPSEDRWLINVLVDGKIQTSISTNINGEWENMSAGYRRGVLKIKIPFKREGPRISVEVKD